MCCAGDVYDPWESARETTVWKTKDVIQCQHHSDWAETWTKACGTCGIALDGDGYCYVLHGWLIVIRDETVKEQIFMTGETHF